MTPVMSLVLVGGLVIALTATRWQTRGTLASLPPIRAFLMIGLHLSTCLAAANIVWLLNFVVWLEWVDRLAVLSLLCLESLFLGIISSLLLYGVEWLNLSQIFHFGQRSQPKVWNMPSDLPQNIVRMHRDYLQPKPKALNSGKAIVWNEWRGCWSSLEAALEDERNALAS